MKFDENLISQGIPAVTSPKNLLCFTGKNTNTAMLDHCDCDFDEGALLAKLIPVQSNAWLNT